MAWLKLLEKYIIDIILRSELNFKLTMAKKEQHGKREDKKEPKKTAKEKRQEKRKKKA